jgi:hypothetical protein
MCNGLPASFTWPMWLRGGEFWIAAASLALALHHHLWLAALAPALALAAFNYSTITIGERFGGARLRGAHRLVPLLLPIMAPVVVATSLVYRRVEWRGRAYDLDAQARLA